MKLTHITPATTDARGSISDILYNVDLQHVAIIESIGDVTNRIRGNHYHKETTQWIFVTRGSLRYCWQPADRSEPIQSIIVGEYDLVETPPMEIHALEILTSAQMVEMRRTQFMVFAKGLRGGFDYEKDTFRVTPPILSP